MVKEALTVRVERNALSGTQMVTFRENQRP